MEWARIGIVLGYEDPVAPWYSEALAHSGISAEPLAELSYDHLSKFDVLLLCGRGSFDDPELLGRWLNEGRRSLVVSGGAWMLEKLLGIHASPTRCSMGQLAPSGVPIWPGDAGRTVYYGGVRARAGNAKTLVTTTDGLIGVSRQGSAWFVSPHVGQTMAYMQLGTSVEAHGVGPEDGSATWDEGPLRAEFGARLDFATREDGMFVSPHADVIREIWLRTILEAIANTGKRTALLWHLPGKATHAGLLSLDCDINNPSNLFQLSAALSMTGSKATMLSRGASLPPEVYGWIRQTGHEIGLSFHEPWRPEKARIAISNLTRISGGQVYTAHLANGAWRGFAQPYEAFAEAGVHTVLSKGGTERGTAGYIFGSAHPFMARPSSVYEIPYQTFNDNWDERLITPVKRHHGVIHSLVTLSSIQDEHGFSELKRWVSLVKQSGGDFFTAERLTNFEKARRSTTVSMKKGGSLHVESNGRLGTFTLLILGRSVAADSGRKAPQVVHRYGHDFTAITLEFGESKSGSVVLSEEVPKAA